MFDGLRTEQDIWKNCINMIISLLEDSLFNDLNPTSKNDAQRLDWLKDDYEITGIDRDTHAYKYMLKYR
jgi:hypothetical protein